HVYKRLAARFPDLSLMIALWHANKPLEESRARMDCADNVPIVRTVKDALSAIERIARTVSGRDAGALPGPGEARPAPQA
ncbi:MAG: hypothetical protein ABIP94_10645, partial [Planctomycetota bacterium]